MDNKDKNNKIRSRNEKFTTRTVTRIWFEEPDTKNPYLASNCLCHGYNLFDLVNNCSLVEVIYLLFRGELPDKTQAKLFETLMISMINPGPRHAATRAAMSSAVSKTNTAHILPISLSVLGGDWLGAKEVENAMKFLMKNRNNSVSEVTSELVAENIRPTEGDWHIAPGFGTRFGTFDVLMEKIANMLVTLPGSGCVFKWGVEFVDSIRRHQCGWLSTGIAAAVFLDLGFHPRVGPGLYQMICAPGLLAHGIEMSNKHITAMPFVDNERYFIE